jgi:hypothetical protein
MTNDDVKIPAAMMSLLRGTESVRGISERLGVTETQVHQWKDIFFAAGVIAIYEARHGIRRGPKHIDPSPLWGTTTTTTTSEPTTTVEASGAYSTKSTSRSRRRS